MDFLRDKIDSMAALAAFNSELKMAEDFFDLRGIPHQTDGFYNDQIYGGPVVSGVIEHPIFSELCFRNVRLPGMNIMIRYIPRHGYKFTHIGGLDMRNKLILSNISKECTYVSTNVKNWPEMFTAEYEKMMALLKKYYIEQQNKKIEQTLDILEG